MKYVDGLTMMRINGDKFALSNGRIHTSGTLAKIALSRGIKLNQSTISKRLKAGERDFDKLIRPPDATHRANASIGVDKRRARIKGDVEFLAALAAVNARRGER